MDIKHFIDRWVVDAEDFEVEIFERNSCEYLYIGTAANIPEDLIWLDIVSFSNGNSGGLCIDVYNE